MRATDKNLSSRHLPSQLLIRSASGLAILAPCMAFSNNSTGLGIAATIMLPEGVASFLDCHDLNPKP